MSIQEVRYKTKEFCRQTQKGCPVCGKSVRRQGDLHHLFVRRAPDHELLYHPINCVLACNGCHVPESKGLNINAARMKVQQYGPDAIENWVSSLPFRVKTLPDFYWKAKEDFLQGGQNV